LARTVLLADDSVTAQNMGRRILMDAGYEVVTVNNGSAALKKIHESKPDLIVLDVYMPGYGGLEVCQRLKESEDTARIPVLLSVGKMEPFKAEEARRVRADGHIVKPFEASELLAALTKLEDRIVPQAESASGRQGKSEKKSRFWKTEDPLAGAEEVPTERVAYLTQAKKRQSHDAAANEAAEADTRESISAVAPAAPAAGTEQLDANRTTSPVSSATEEFAVRESDVPADVPVESGGNDWSPAELQAAEPVVEIPAPVEVGSVENLNMEYPTAEIPVAEDPAGPAALSRESISEEAVSGPSAEMVTPTEAPAVARASSASRWIAENVALTVEEASVALEAEMQQAQAVSAELETQTGIPAQDQVTGSNPVEAQTVQEAENQNPTGAAFAAAASAAGSVQQSAVSTQRASAAAGDTDSVSEAELPAASEAAAAWQNWQQIREAVMSPQKAAELAESVAEIAQASVAAQEPTSRQDSAPSDSASPAPAEDDNSINDIVDSVLADLKPRLMAEIAKKLAAKK
jgi:CheY-like chemotaxis protein